MQFSKEQNLTFEQAVEKMFEKLGDSKIMALASAVGTHVMVRNVSCLFYNNKIYFKTDPKDPAAFRKSERRALLERRSGRRRRGKQGTRR